jgi:hypothetical protein
VEASLSNRTKLESGSERTCIVTRAKAGPGEMIRFVLGPEAEVVADLRRKLPGRGVWVAARADAVAAAVQRKAFARAFKAEVKVSGSLSADIEALLTEGCLQALSLAKKSGQVVTGFFKAEAAIKSGSVVGLVHASDGSADGGRKLSQALRRRCGGQERAEIRLFTSLQLSLALGLTNVIHAALTEGTASEAFLSHCRRLERYRSAPLVSDPSDSAEGALEAKDDGAI